MIVILIRLQATLKQGFLSLRECLAVAMVVVGCEGAVMGEDEVCESLKKTEGVRQLFGSVCGCLEKLARRRRKRSSKEELVTSEEEKEEEHGDSGTDEEEEQEVWGVCT